MRGDLGFKVMAEITQVFLPPEVPHPVGASAKSESCKVNSDYSGFVGVQVKQADRFRAIFHFFGPDFIIFALSNSLSLTAQGGPGSLPGLRHWSEDSG